MTGPLTIVYVWDADYPWDVRTEKVCATLTAAGHDVHLVARNRRQATTVERLPEATVHRMPPWRLLGHKLDGQLGFPAFINPRWLRLIDQVVRSVAADLIIVRDLPLCPAAIWVGRRRRIPILFDMAENYPALLKDVWETGRARPLDWLVRNPGFARRVERFALARVDRIMVVIEEAADHIKKLGVPPERIHVVSNTPPQARVTRTAEQRAIDIAYLGIMELARGLGLLIDALSELTANGVRVRTRLIGGGRDLDLIRTRARAQGLGADAIEFTGFVPDHGVALTMMAEARIGILPHLVNDWARTTIPNKLFDYMAAGMAVLSSDAPPCRRIIEASGAGRVFRSGDPIDLAKVLGEMLSDPAQLAAYGKAGQAAITAHYNWEADGRELLAAVNLTASRQ